LFHSLLNDNIKYVFYTLYVDILLIYLKRFRLIKECLDLGRNYLVELLDEFEVCVENNSMCNCNEGDLQRI